MNVIRTCCYPMTALSLLVTCAEAQLPPLHPESADIRETRDPARRDHRNADQVGDFLDPGRIDAGLRAVARDVGDDCRGDACLAKALCGLGDGQLRWSRPIL